MNSVRWLADEVPALERPILVAALASAQTGSTGAAVLAALREQLGAGAVAEIDADQFYDFTVARPLVHFDEAGERLDAARWHEQAGRRVARSDPAAGARHCHRVTTLLAAVPESRDTLMLELTSRIARLEIGRIAGIEAREARHVFDEARAVAERLHDRAGHAFLLTSYPWRCSSVG